MYTKLDTRNKMSLGRGSWLLVVGEFRPMLEQEHPVSPLLFRSKWELKKPSPQASARREAESRPPAPCALAAHGPSLSWFITGIVGTSVHLLSGSPAHKPCRWLKVGWERGGRYEVRIGPGLPSYRGPAHPPLDASKSPKVESDSVVPGLIVQTE